MSRTDPYAEFQKQSDPYAEFQSPQTPQDGIVDHLVNATIDYGKGLNRTLNPFSQEGRQAAAQLVYHPMDTARAALDAQGRLYQASRESFQNKDYINGVRHAISYLIPVLGPAIDEAGNKAGQGQVAEGLGEATGIGVNAALTTKGFQQTPAPVETPPKPTVSARATELYRTALKRGVKTTEDVADVRQMAETGLQYKIPVSEAGVQKLQGLIADTEKKVQAATGRAVQQGVTVNKYKVASRLSAQAAKASEQATPQADLAAISKTGNEFLEAQPTEIPADVAQRTKQGTYRAVGEKAYGELQTASKEAQKNLARGIREELAAQIPEIADLTPEQGKMLDLDGALEKAVNKQANLQGSIFRETVAGVSARALTGSDALGVVAGVLRHVWGDPEFRSKLAIAINRAQQNNPGKWGAPNIKTATTRVNTLLESLEPAQ